MAFSFFLSQMGAGMNRVRKWISEMKSAWQANALPIVLAASVSVLYVSLSLIQFLPPFSRFVSALIILFWFSINVLVWKFFDRIHAISLLSTISLPYMTSVSLIHSLFSDSSGEILVSTVLTASLIAVAPYYYRYLLKHCSYQ